MRLISPLLNVFRKWKDADRARQQLHALLEHVEPQAPLVERNQWLIELMRWVHGDSHLEGGDEATLRPLARLRYLLNVLDRNPEWQHHFVVMLQSIFRDLDGVALLCDTGLAQNPGYWSELSERALKRLIPPTPNTQDWSSLLTLLFPYQGDADWLAQLDAATFTRVLALFDAERHDAHMPSEPISELKSKPKNELKSELKNAANFGRPLAQSIEFLVTQIQAAGLLQVVRSRMGFNSFDDSPFLSLARCADAVLSVHESADRLQAPFLQNLNVLRARLDECREAAQKVFEHLDEYGISVEIVFQVERILARIQRIELLLEAWLQPHEPVIIGHMLTDLIQKHQAGLSMLDLTRRNFAQLARKVVERSAETGEHYIARDRNDYRGMIHAALGGGVVTALTVYLKFFITALHLPKLAEGLLSSFNYVGSFLIIHFAGFTLATKQPAMTAPALASKLEDVGRAEGLNDFVQETISLIRSQVAAIFGNLAAVTPIALAVQLLAWHAFGTQLITPQKAQATIASFSLLGPTPFFAMFTGVLLWLSSLCSGWADNWFAYRRIGDVIGYNRRLRWVFGERATMALAKFWLHHISGVAANVSLGLMLALVPILISVFLPFDIEVRHVTLSTGALSASLGVLGWSVLTTPGFWLAVGGIASMGLLNLAVSFALAFHLALRARELGGQRWHIYRAILSEIVQHPLSLFFPTGMPTESTEKSH